MSDKALLEDYIVKTFDLSRRTVMAFFKECESFVPAFGYVKDLDDLVSKYVAWLQDQHEVIVASGSGMHVYMRETGCFNFVERKDIEKNILEGFAGLAMLQRKSCLQMIIDRVLSFFYQKDFFADACPGVNLRNGFVALNETGTPVLLPHSPNHKARMQVNVDYDASASFEWLERALQLTLPDAVLRQAMQEVAGAILFNVRPPKDQVRRMVLLYGARNSGKSTLINLMKRLFPEPVVGSVPPGHWSSPIYRAALENIMLNCVTELGASTRIGGEHMKQIVSGEPIIARRLYGNPGTIVPHAWHLFAANELPRVVDKTDAFERRLLVLTFPHSLTDTQVDSSLAQRIEDDPNAIIAWAAAGAARVMHNGRLTLPPGHATAAAEMQFGDDWLMVFVRTQIQRTPGARITTDNMRAAIEAFAESREIKVDHVNPGMMRRVSDALSTLYGATRRQSTGKPYQDGVSFVSPQMFEERTPEEVGLDDL